MSLERLQRLLDQIANILALLLAIVDTVAAVQVHVLESVQNGQDLAVVWYERLADMIGAHDKMLKHLERRADDRSAASVKRVLDRDYKLRYNRQDLAAAVFEHVVYALPRKELVRMRRLAEAVEEERQVVMVVQFFNLDLPRDTVALSVVIKRNREIATLVKLAKSRWFRGTLFEGTGSGRLLHLCITHAGFDRETRRLHVKIQPCAELLRGTCC